MDGDDCAKLFEGFTDETCVFLNAREVQATPASALDIGANVRLKAGVLTAEDACEPTNDRGEVVEIQAPEDPQPLTMTMTADAEIGTCRELVLEGEVIGGAAGRSVDWEWTAGVDGLTHVGGLAKIGEAELADHRYAPWLIALFFVVVFAFLIYLPWMVGKGKKKVVAGAGLVRARFVASPEATKALDSALRYADSLRILKRFEETRTLLRKAIPVARRVLGEGRETTLRLRWNYAMALSPDTGATLDDIREAVTTLEEIERTARRVLGGAHPITTAIEHHLRVSRAKLSARETPSPGSA